jgi:hypothetical protein
MQEHHPHFKKAKAETSSVAARTGKPVANWMENSDGVWG